MSVVLFMVLFMVLFVLLLLLLLLLLSAKTTDNVGEDELVTNGLVMVALILRSEPITSSG